MNQRQKARLTKLATFLCSVPRKHFNLDVVTAGDYEDIYDLKLGETLSDIGKTCKVHKCGAAACAMGWTPAVFPRKVYWDDVGDVKAYSGEWYWEEMQEFFGLDGGQSHYLFQPDSYNSYDNSVTPKRVAKRIMDLVNKDGKFYSTVRHTESVHNTAPNMQKVEEYC